jgi:OmpA-OmpF porin, OOP family
MRVANLSLNEGLVARREMQMNHVRIVGAGLLAALLAAGEARADESGFYLGASAGEARQKSGDFEGTDNSFKVFGGYSFNEYLAAEAGYVDGGRQVDHAGPLRLAVDSSGLFVAGLAKLPIGRYVAPYVKVGYVFYDSTATVSSGAQTLYESRSDEDLLYGIGCEFKLGENFRLRVEYERVDVSDADFDIFSITAAFQF